MLSGCKALQILCAIVIVILILLTVMMLIGVMGGSAAAAETIEGEGEQGNLAAMGTAGVLIWAAINIGITALFMKIFGDCAKRIDILSEAKLPVKPDLLKPALEDKVTAASIGNALSLEESPIVEGQAAYQAPEPSAPSKEDE